MASPASKVKLFMADKMTPSNPVDGTSLEEIMNVFMASISAANILDVNVSLAKTGKYGENFMFAGSVLYKG